MKKPAYFLTALFFLAIFTLFGQEADTGGIHDGANVSELPQEQISPGDKKLYVITDFEFDIKGRTRPDALMYNGEFNKGEKIQGNACLEKYIRDKTQLLINQRVLKDNVEISYAAGEQEPDGTYPVTLTIKVEDTWNIIPLPKPEYNSNTGFNLTIKIKDYNFLGTMEPLTVDLGYSYDEDNRNSFLFGIYSDIPFRAFGFNWNFLFDNSFDYRPDVEQPFYYQNVTGLSMELPFRATTFTFGFKEYFTLNEENSDRYKDKYGNFQEGLYMSSKLYTSWRIPTGLSVLQYGDLAYTPEVSATFNHGFPQWPLHEFRKGPFIGFSHSLGFEKIDWHTNYRNGLSVSLSNSYSYDFFRLRDNKEPLSVTFQLNGTGHFVISDFLGISSRLSYRQWFYHDPGYYENAGDYLRGIADKAICSDYMLSLNTDFPFRVLVFAPSEWFNSWKTTFFNFELQASPVIDLALYHDPATGISFNPKNIAASGGIEFRVFPAFFRSFYIRLSLAWNLREFAAARPVKFPGGENREIFFGTGLFY